MEDTASFMDSSTQSLLFIGKDMNICRESIAARSNVIRDDLISLHFAGHIDLSDEPRRTHE
jgi:hypothetical protein